MADAVVSGKKREKVLADDLQLSLGVLAEQINGDCRGPGFGEPADEIGALFRASDCRHLRKLLGGHVTRRLSFPD